MSFTRLDIFVLIIIACLGIINLPVPFAGDQALFITGAREMAKGEVLYRDFWDIKPPGIYLFYYTAGTLFGFNETGIHLFELIFWIFFSVCLIAAFKSLQVFENKFFASLTPLFTAGIYYALTTGKALTQVEGIINIFLFTALWLAVISVKNVQHRTLFILLSGFLGGIILTFKLMFLPIIAVFWFSVLLQLIFREKENSTIIFKKFIIPLAAGLFIPLAVIFIYFLRHGILEIVYNTLFIYPPRLISETPFGGYDKLYKLFILYIENFYPMIALAVLGSFAAIFQKKDIILINMVSWFILGVIIIILTRTSWWPYHLHLLNVPMGILFLASLDFIWSAVKKYDIMGSWKGKLTGVIVLIILFYPGFQPVYSKIKFFRSYASAQSIEEKKKLYAVSEREYAFAFRCTDILMQPNSLDGDIYVISTPLIYYITGRYQGIAITGWILELIVREQWDQLNDQIKEKKPVYIFMDRNYTVLIPDIKPETVEIIKSGYNVVRENNDGIWFALKDEYLKK